MDIKNGRAAILFPHGVLFRKEESSLRAKLVNSGMLEAVIGLGAGLFYNSPMEAVVIILRNGRSAVKSGKTIFINAVDLVTRDRAFSYLNADHQNIIHSVYTNFVDEPGLSKVQTAKDIERNDFSLSIPLYVERGSSEDRDTDLPISEIYENWIQDIDVSETNLKSIFKQFPLKDLI